jgi:S1-C subfamily serine protease
MRDTFDKILKFITYLSFAALLFPREALAFCKNPDYKTQCSNLDKASSELSRGNYETYTDYLAYPPIFHSDRQRGRVQKSQIKSAKRFLKISMDKANQDPLLAFYVGSVLRKGHWSLEGYGYGYGTEQHSIYRKQIQYFEKSLSMKDGWFRETAAKILGNIYYYGLLKPYANPYPYTVDVDYEKAAKYYKVCGASCTFNYLSSLLHVDPKKGLALLDKIPGFSGSEKYDDQFMDAEIKYQYLWAIHRFGMFGVAKDKKTAKKFYSILDKHSDGLPLYGADLSTGKGLYSLFEIMEKETVFSDGAVRQSIPTTLKAEIEVLHLALAKKQVDAAKELYGKYSKGIGVSKDFLRAYSYLNLAAGFSTTESDRELYNDWMDEQARKWKLTAQQTIYAQQLSNKIMIEARELSGTEKKSSASKSQGTGFYISKSGHIVTNQHVVKGCSNISLGVKGKHQIATLVAEDPTNDMAILKSKKSNHVAYVRGGRGLRQGDDVIAYGYPLSNLLSSSAKITTGIVNSLSGLANDYRYMQISAQVQPGSSGGPLLDKSGNVVGIVTAKLNAARVQKLTGDIPQNINFAIKASAMKEFLDAHDVAYETRTSKEAAGASDIAEDANKFTVKIQCQ